MDLDRQPVLEGDGLIMRPLQDSDADALYAAASDPKIWEMHPAKTRHKRETFETYFAFLQSTKEALVARDATSGEVIGCSRYYSSPDRPGEVAIGFTFLKRAYWGGETNFKMKKLMLQHAFTQHDAVWFDIGPDNLRSQKATMKLGAEFVYAARLDLGTGPSDYYCYRLMRHAWADVVAERARP